MTTMLDLLDQETDSIRTGQEPDYESMRVVMEYMTIYSDAVHHANENALYRAMLALDSKLAAGMERVGPEHHDIEQLGATLLEDINAIIVGGDASQEKLVADATDYSRKLRSHMAWEETDLFVRADALAKEEDSLFTGRYQADHPDPVFGPKPDHSFAGLLQRIKEGRG